MDVRGESRSVLESDLEPRSPILSGHLDLHGSHHDDGQARKQATGTTPLAANNRTALLT
ncbi:MAG TPA: hypothetical protein VKV20_11500 [Ktedonobacteraceae bacterium]|nr:hypothetical protein [Ktedonobacteraceae bacterium]